MGTKPKQSDFDKMMEMLHSVPGVKEHGEWFEDRSKKRIQRFLDMGMNERDANELGWLFTFHETEDPSVYARFKNSKGEQDNE